MSSSLWLTSLKIQSRQIRLIAFAATLVLYAASFALLYENVGGALAALAILPVAVGAWFFGLRFGIIAAFLLLFLNTVLFDLFGGMNCRNQSRPISGRAF